jgi:inosine triphosphate pyrophosphatase
MKKQLYFITGNSNKFIEVKNILDDDNTEVIQCNIDLSEYQGDSHTIALKKCLEARKIIYEQNMNECYPFIIDDTSLGFNCLNGMPGPYIKWFLDAIKPDGLVKMLNSYDDKTATAICNISYLENENSEPKIFSAVVNGIIVPPRGATNFGWDPIFQPELDDFGGNGLTYAEMDKTYKNQISHRYKALMKLKEYLSK